MNPGNVMHEITSVAREGDTLPPRETLLSPSCAPPSHPVPSALTIAGSDPSGGAGVQVDLKTFSCIGVYGMAVITALTAQNSGRVGAVWPVSAEQVRSQLDLLLEDFTPGAVKTGMLATGDIIDEVSAILPQGIPLVVDPVMVSTSGHRLLAEDAVESMIQTLFPRSLIVTPNIPEACVLTGRDHLCPADVVDVGEEILRMGPGYVCIKGGHAGEEESIDHLFSHNGMVSFAGPRYPFDVHGSGCCFSSAITGFLSLGEDVPAACRKAKSFITLSIERAISGNLGKMVIYPSR